MARRKLQELNLLDDFLFNVVLNHPEAGEKFGRELLRVIFQREFGKLTVTPQKAYRGTDTDKHGAVLDVYLEEEADLEAMIEATVYDVESNLNKDKEDIEVLPKRVRFYHALIGAKSLQSGAEYKMLKKVIVIMITPYDPFGYDYMVYTVDNKIRELPQVPYDDGAQTLFLYTKGRKGVVSEELRQFLRYMEHTTKENAVNENLREIHQMVEQVKNDEEVSIEFMKVFEREQRLLKQGIEQGIELERQNTERERQNTERERAEKEQALKEVERLKEKLQQLQAQRL